MAKDKQATIDGVPLVDADGDAIMESAFEKDGSERMEKAAVKKVAKESSVDFLKKQGFTDEEIANMDIDDER